MKNIVLPPDVKKVARKNIFRTVLKFIFTEGFFLFFIFILCYVLLASINSIYRIVLAIVLAALSAWLTDIPKLFSERDWCGEITKVQVSTRGKVHGFVRLKFSFENAVSVTAKTDKGREIQKKVIAVNVPKYNDKFAHNRYYEEGKLNEQKIGEFKVGAKIYCFRGLDYAFVLPDENDEFCSCVVCGQKNRIDDDVCWNCEHTLIKIKSPSDLEKE